MITRRLFSCTLAASMAAAGIQVALCESGVPRADADAIAMSIPPVRDAMSSDGPRSNEPAIQAGSPTDRPLERDRRIVSVI